MPTKTTTNNRKSKPTSTKKRTKSLQPTSKTAVAETKSVNSASKQLSPTGKKTKTKSDTGSQVQLDRQFVLVPPEQADEMMRILTEQYPNAECELDFDSTFQLLIAVILSAQTTDSNVNKVTPALFKRFPIAKDLAEADLDEIKSIVKPTGYYNAKATNIQRCAQTLVERFAGEVPSTLEELVTLPGVGRKTANVVLGVAFQQAAWTVDTHVQRLVRRLGFTNETDPLKIELSLQELFPKADWSRYSITLIWHGRRLCYALKPACLQCPLKSLCPSAQI